MKCALVSTLQLKHWVGKALVSSALPTKVKPNLINDNTESRGKPVYLQAGNQCSLWVNQTCWFKNESVTENTVWCTHNVHIVWSWF